MKILLDAYWWFDGPPSGRNVVKSLALTWAESHPEDEITLLLPKAIRQRDALGRLATKHPNLQFRHTRAPVHALAAVTAGALSKGFDVVLTQNFAPLVGTAQRCVFIHDLMFTERPEWFTRAERVYLGGIAWSARRAHQIFTSSKSEADRIRRRLSSHRAPITDVGLALNREYAAARPDPVLAASLPDKFLLSVGRINVRKNLETLVRALSKASLITAARPLVIVGAADGAQGETKALDAATAQGSVVWTGSVSDGELKWMFQRCTAFLFPSLDEGFGLPVMEALDAGARIGMSDIPAFREFGDVGVFFDPTDDSDIATKIASLLRSPQRPSRDHPPTRSWETVVADIRGRITTR